MTSCGFCGNAGPKQCNQIFTCNNQKWWAGQQKTQSWDGVWNSTSGSSRWKHNTGAMFQAIKGNISVYLPTNCKTAFKYHSARTCCLPSQDPDGFGYPLSLYITQLILDEHLGTSLSISMAMTGTCFLQNSLILHLYAHFLCAAVQSQDFQLLAFLCIWQLNPSLKSLDDVRKLFWALDFTVTIDILVRFLRLWDNQIILCILKYITNYRTIIQMLVGFVV